MTTKDQATEATLPAGPTGDHRPCQDATQFQRQAEETDMGLVAELLLFLRENKKWWLIPLIVSLLCIGLLSLIAASGAAPFIYTLF